MNLIKIRKDLPQSCQKKYCFVWPISFVNSYCNVDNQVQIVADVPVWLKYHRLHKYSPLFAQLTYDEMMELSEEQLEAHVQFLFVINLLISILNNLMLVLL